jgi:hypothetical protein
MHEHGPVTALIPITTLLIAQIETSLREFLAVERIFPSRSSALYTELKSVAQ